MEASTEALPSEKDAKSCERIFWESVFSKMDFDRVYDSDRKKMVKWFTQLKSK